MAASTVLSATGDILDEKAGSKNGGKSAESKRPVQPPIQCPECGSLRIWKDGFRYTIYINLEQAVLNTSLTWKAIKSSENANNACFPSKITRFPLKETRR